MVFNFLGLNSKSYVLVVIGCEWKFPSREYREFQGIPVGIPKPKSLSRKLNSVGGSSPQVDNVMTTDDDGTGKCVVEAVGAAKRRSRGSWFERSEKRSREAA